MPRTTWSIWVFSGLVPVVAGCRGLTWRRGLLHFQKPCDGRAKAGKIARQAQGVGTSKLSPATASVHVHKVKVPFGTKKAQADSVVQRPSQSVLMFG